MHTDAIAALSGTAEAKGHRGLGSEPHLYDEVEAALRTSDRVIRNSVAAPPGE